MKGKEQFLKITLLILVLLMGVIIFMKSLPFLSGILGACTVYILVRKQMKRLTEQRKFKRSMAAMFIIVEVLLCFLIPVFLIAWVLANKIQSADLNVHGIMLSVHSFIGEVTARTGFDLLGTDNLSKYAGFATSLAQMIVDQVSSFFINSLVLLFILYFMLVSREAMESYLYKILPFKEKYKRRVISEVDKMVKANAIGIPLLAIVQGFFAGIGYLIFGAPDPLLLGFITCFATIIPLIGTALIWVPLALYMGFTGSWGAAIGIVAFGVLVISNIDNLVRFMLQEKIASTHPLITVFGVVIGITIFGFWGIIFGPLLLSMFFLCFDIYKKEFIDTLN